MSASRLTGATVHVEVRVSIGTPLAKDTSSGVQNVHKVRVSVVQITGSIRTHVEEYSWVET